MIGRIYNIIRALRLYKRRYYIKHNCKEYFIIKEPQKVFDILYHIKDETWETNYAPPVFESAKERSVTGRFPALNIYKIPDAIVCTDSDIVLTGNEAYWDKFVDDDFTACAVPADSNVCQFSHDKVWVSKMDTEVRLSGKTFSLIGVWSTSWAHFIYQFLGKMYYAGEAGLFDQDIFLLTDDVDDPNIEQIIEDYIGKYPLVKRIKAKIKTEYHCEELIFSPSLANNFNECKYYLEYRFITPQNDVDIIRKYFVDPLNSKIKDRPTRYKKIFLPRTNNRFLNNNEEVESYFKNEGFHFLKTDNMSLEEKADIFYHAEIIVGVGGGAFINLIFCHGARCLYLTNNRYATDMLGSTLTRGRVSAYLNLAGYDDNSDRRSNFTIPLDKIKRAYNRLIQGEYDIL